MFYSCSGAVGRRGRCLNPASNVRGLALDDATPPKHVSHYDFLGGIVHICVCALKNGKKSRNTGDVTST